MSRKNKTEKASGAVWKDQSTMAAVAKQKAAQEGQANTGSSYIPSLHHEGSGDTSPLHHEGMDYISPLRGDTPPGSETRHAAMAMPTPNCRLNGPPGVTRSIGPPGVTRSLADTVDVQFGSGSIQPIFELECDGNADDDVFETSCHDDDSDEQSGEKVTMRATQTSRPVDIPRQLSPYGSMRDSPPETRMFLTPPGQFAQRQRFTTGSLMCPSGTSISGQVPLGPDNVMVHEGLAWPWTQDLLTTAQQGEDDPPRIRFSSLNPAAEDRKDVTNLVTSRDRCQSAPSVMSRTVLERQFGRELRRISDEFHLAYGMGQLRLAQGARRVNGHRPASFPCNQGNQPGWWQLILAYMSPRRPNTHRPNARRRCILEQPTDSSDRNDSSLAERDRDEDEDPV